MNSHYPLFVLMACLTVLMPGPGVLMTLTNALRFGLHGSLGGILGIASGALVVATISSTSLGLLLASSALAFTVIKWMGAAYLVYLGLRLWRSPTLGLAPGEARPASFGRRFAEGLSLQFTNPKAIFFFLSVLPQFIDPAGPRTQQFVVLVLSYSVLVVLIHTLYALGAQRVRGWLSTARGQRTLGRLGGATFVAFGVGLASSPR
jgi:threonine/homoserine/homoserine lactone efflux protein